MEKPTLDLVNEHSGIMLMLQIMNRVSQRLLARENVDKDDLEKIVEFLRNFADKCHHGKEEGILFPEIVRHSTQGFLVNELLGEHKSGRDLIKGMVQSLESYEPGNSDAFHIAVNAHEYVTLLKEHIEKENAVLFPQADKDLPLELQQEIVERFENLERDVIGAGKHEEYHGWLKELEGKYLEAADHCHHH